MNLRWDYKKIYADLNKLKINFDNLQDEYQKYLLVMDRNLCLILLNKINTNFFKLSAVDEYKYRYYFENIFQNEKNKLLNIMYDNYENFSKLINNVANLNVILNNDIIQNNFIIDTKSFSYIKKFFQNFDNNLYIHFNNIYKGKYINITLENNDLYNGYCINLNSNKKNYIQIFASKPYYILPTIIHEIGHTYENIMDKKDNSWLNNLNIYMEVFPIFLTSIFDNYILNTDYYNQGNYDIYDFIKTNFLLSKDLNNNFPIDCLDNLTDFIYFYCSNIALAFLEQYNVNKSEAKKNVNYFIKNNDVLFSDNLLSTVDIDLSKLYSGIYYKDFCDKHKRLIKSQIFKLNAGL